MQTLMWAEQGKEQNEMEFILQGRKVEVYGAAHTGAPVVYLNTVHGEGNAVWRACQRLGCPPFTLAAVSGIQWDHDMSPWPIPAIAIGDTPCTGGADDYLAFLTKKLLPAVEETLGGKPKYSAIAGYSLAGLFAVYASYRTDVFARLASVSGSLWFPDFVEFVKEHEMRRIPEKMYFSLGDREAHTKNPYLSCVEERTRLLYEYYSCQGIQTTFVLNPGNHFREAERRMADGIRWILDDSLLSKPITI